MESGKCTENTRAPSPEQRTRGRTLGGHWDRRGGGCSERAPQDCDLIVGGESRVLAALGAALRRGAVNSIKAGARRALDSVCALLLGHSHSPNVPSRRRSEHGLLCGALLRLD